MQRLKKYSKQEKFFFTTVQRVNLKILCADFCYNLYHLMASKIKRAF